MNRRDFLKTLSAGGLLLGSGLSPWLSRVAQAATVTLPAGFPSSVPRILINITLDGGPDFRHLLPPKFVNDPTSYGYQYWKYRATAHSIAQNDTAYQARWDNDFLKPNQTPAPVGQEFGILNSADWLHSVWEAGNVAIVNNALVSDSRDHAHSLLILEQGDRSTGPHDLDKPGWGGRLAAAIQAKLRQSDAQAQAKIIALTSEVRRFCYGPHPSDPRKHLNDQVIAIRDARRLGLYEADTQATGYNPTGLPTVMSRALKAYYAAKRNELDKSSPYYKFIQTESDLRRFGDLIKARLIGDDPMNPLIPIPDAIRALYDMEFAQQNNRFALNNAGFGDQMRNLYDCLACQDILNFRIASLAYRGWDTHKNQKRYIEQRFEDLFHSQGALATLYQQLPASISDNLVIVLSGEFGRQLKANGDNGTDHGRGNSILVLGKSVRGGLYGDPYPTSELERIERRSPDITGKTAVEQIFAAVCEQIEPGTAASVFPGYADMPLEDRLPAGPFTA